METIKKYYRADRSEIAFLKFILEAYDGIAMMETVDALEGLVLFHIAPGCEEDMERLLQDMMQQMHIEPVMPEKVSLAQQGNIL